MKKILITFTAFMLMLVGCGSNKNNQSNKIKVVTSFFPLYDFATKIGGEWVEVESLVPYGQGTHGYELSPKDRIKIEEADIFVYNGAGLESWVDSLLNSLKNKNVLVVESTKNLNLLESSAHDHEEEHDHENEDAHGHEDHDHGVYDPHTWLNPLNARSQMESIKDALVEKDPEHKTTYEENFLKYSQEFEKLDEAYKEAVSASSKREIVVDHQAFSYMANQYGLIQRPIVGLIPDTEPFSTQLQEILSFIKANNITVILMEKNSNEKVTNLIKKETDVDVQTLNSIESVSKKELDNNEDYFSFMYQNLESLKIALK